MVRSFSAVYRGVAVKSNVAENGQKIVHAKLFYFRMYTDVSIATACEEISASSD